MRTWLTDAADLPPLLRGDRATVGDHGVPVLDTSDVNDRKRCRTRSPSTSAGSTSAASTRSAGCCTWRSPAPRTRCCCPVITGAPPRASRAGRRSSSASSRTSSTARPPPASRAASSSTGRPRPPTASRTRCGTRSIEAVWPADPAGSRRGDVDRGAALVRRAMAGGSRRRPTTPTTGPPTSTPCSPSGTGSRRNGPPTLPAALSVSSLVDLGRDPDARGAAVAPPAAGPPRPACLAGHRISRLGAAVLRRRAAVRPRRSARGGRRQLARADAESLAELQAAFVASPWAARTPIDVEVPFDMVIGGTVVRGRIDAVFADATTAPRSSTGRPATRRTPRRPSATPPFSSPSTGWRGRRCAACPPHRSARRSTTCGPGRPSSPIAAGRRRAGRAAGVTRRLGVAVDLQRLR